MQTYHLDELTLRLPPGFEDRSLHVFTAPPAKSGMMSLTVSREPRSSASVSEQAETILSRLAAAFSGVKLLARRNGTVGTLTSYEARIEARHGKMPIYQRVAFVGWYETLVVLSVTTVRARRQQADTLADRWLGSFRFRRREP